MSSIFDSIAQVNDHLYISSIRAVTYDTVRKHGITCIVNSTVEMQNLNIANVEYLCVRVDDSPTANLSHHFDTVADKIDEVQRRGGRTLVHCIAGCSRSASLCLAYLMKYQKMNLRDAFLYLKDRRPVIRPNNGFFQQLIDYESRLFGGKSTVKMVQIASSELGLVVPDVCMQEQKGFVWLESLRNTFKKSSH